MAALASAVGVLSDNWVVNRATLVDKAKVLIPFPDVEWDGAIWDVSLAYQHRTRGYKADRPVQRLLFTQHSRVPRIPVSSLMLFSEELESDKRSEKIRVAMAANVLKVLDWVAADDERRA
ncbi:hypothetical protein WM29_14195 [Burkholderia ubonensis]|uniref:hypothetical protein n=1 Tax=Burkholderia ubonensis TaxID=101571 RepID=UPI000841302D|nr:hypothetical protein [Burkholderia ubonensis]AOK60168.1 hypothetical protein WM29_14195 [Burkholderia ubonensis]